jgi:glycerol-3-phosphate cytidylyltransferase
MAKIKTSKGYLHYNPVNVYTGKKEMNHEVAFENFKVVIRVLQNVGIRVSPAYGTLLGIIRENNFIEWDKDIDLFVLGEDKEKLLDSFWQMKKEGLEVIRVDRCDHLFSVMRNGEYIDFYIMDKITPEIRSAYGEGFMFENHLTDLIDWNFKGVTISVPREYEQCLEFLYGDWRTPVKYYSDSEQNEIRNVMNVLYNYVKKLIPFSIRFWLLKRYHRKDLAKFLAKCEKKNVHLNYEINL